MNQKDIRNFISSWYPRTYNDDNTLKNHSWNLKTSCIKFLLDSLLGTFGSDCTGNHERNSIENEFHFSLSQAKGICMWLFEEHWCTPAKDLSVTISFTDLYGIKKVIKAILQGNQWIFFTIEKNSLTEQT